MNPISQIFAVEHLSFYLVARLSVASHHQHVTSSTVFRFVVQFCKVTVVFETLDSRIQRALKFNYLYIPWESKEQPIQFMLISKASQTDDFKLMNFSRVMKTTIVLFFSQICTLWIKYRQMILVYYPKYMKSNWIDFIQWVRKKIISKIKFNIIK